MHLGGMRRLGTALLLGLFAVAAAGCDFLKASGPGVSQNPVIGNLSISKSPVLCVENFTLSFDYSDPQGDIALMTVSYVTNSTGVVRRTVDVPWATGNGLDLANGARAVYTTKFDCSDPSGTYTIRVVVEDLKGNQSAPRTIDVVLG